MQTIEALYPVRPIQSPRLPCGELPDFDESDLVAIQRAFKAVKPCQLHQAWRSEPSLGFAPASVRVGRRDDCLLVFAELTDQDIFSSARRFNQRLWELGDAFEIYLRPADRTAYLQVDISPNNQRVQLRIPSAEAIRRAQTANEFADLVSRENVVRSATWLMPEDEKWFVFAAIPAQAVCGSANLRAEKRWCFSFARYDYTRGQLEPVISSTSPHGQANFHRQEEWGVIQFEHGSSARLEIGQLAAC